jgi:hypothetical protein
MKPLFAALHESAAGPGCVKKRPEREVLTGSEIVCSSA